MNKQDRSRLWQLLTLVPTGKVTTYKELSQKLQTSPRAIGRWLHMNVDPVSYPCHRVVRVDGSLASGYVFGGREAQKKLLVQEGIKFDKSGKIRVEYFL